MTRKEYELRKIRSNHNELLKAKLIQQITKTYTESMLEIDRKNLSKINQAEPLRIDFFLRSMFFFIFSKMHKGDRLRAFEILEELKLNVYNL